MPAVLSVAGSDSAGFAGLQMDQRSMQALGVHCLCAVTATTAQDGRKLCALNPVPLSMLQSQIDAALGLKPALIKAGVLANAAQLELLVKVQANTQLPLVYDPVGLSSSGQALMVEDLRNLLREKLLPKVSLLTPNLPEAEWLLGHRLQSAADMERAARELLSLGCRAVLLKGGHVESRTAADFFCSADQQFWLESPMGHYRHVRGSGCALASSIAAALALGHPLQDAVVIGKMCINQGLRQGCEIGDVPGPLQPGAFPTVIEDLPALFPQPYAQRADLPGPFPDCGSSTLGLYPVIDSVAWLKRLLQLGISTVQLRIKTLQGEALSAVIAEAGALAKAHDCRLFINDYWQLAIEHGAYGVHLGQEDLGTADLAAIHRAGLRLGISTHCHMEVARAHALRPSYIACGPVYATTTKDMPWTSLGMQGLRYWRRVLSDYPLVAIGGIDGERLKEVAATGVDGIAMITAITRADDPERVVREMKGLIREVVASPQASMEAETNGPLPALSETN